MTSLLLIITELQLNKSWIQHIMTRLQLIMTTIRHILKTLQCNLTYILTVFYYDNTSLLWQHYSLSYKTQAYHDIPLDYHNKTQAYHDNTIAYHNRLTRNDNPVMRTLQLREATRDKKQLNFGFLLNHLDPPPPPCIIVPCS